MLFRINRAIQVGFVLISIVATVAAHISIGWYGYWAGGLPLKPTRVIEFTTDEGTGVSVDVSPDGKTIVFDLLGDLYAIPITGGEARKLTSGIAVDSLPRYSPDGSRIAFVSDRSGMANIWTIGADGSNPQRVSNHTLLLDPNSPARIHTVIWSADGQYVFAVNELYSGFDLPSHLWRYEIRNGGATDLTPDLKESIAKGGVLDSSGAHFWHSATGSQVGLAKRELATGRTEFFKISGNSIERPLISPNGRWLVYVLGIRPQNDRFGYLRELRLHDLTRGSFEEDKVLTGETNEPDISIRSVAIQFSFTPDSRSVVFSSEGKIKQVDIATGTVREIPFTANVRLELGPQPKPTVEFTGPLRVKQLRSVNSTADGEHVVFSALGKIWMQSGGGKPKRITTSDWREYDPVLSPDGRWIGYVTWSFKDGGKLWKMPVTGGQPVKLTESKDALSTPRWTPDGLQFVVFRIKAERTMDGYLTEESVLLRVAADTGQATEIAPALDMAAHGQHLPLLTISSDGRRVYFVERSWKDAGGLDISTLTSVSLDGTDRRLHARIKGHDVMAVPSPDGKWLAIHNSFNIYLLPFPELKDGEPPLIKMKGPNPEPTARQLALEGGAHPMWSADGKYLSWYWANQLYKLPYEEAVSRKGPIKPRVTQIDLTVPRHEPKGHLLLSKARIITVAASGSPTIAEYKGKPMPTDPKVIEPGDVLLEGARIKVVGASGTLKIPRDTKIVNLSGKTIVPGYIATHEHRLTSTGGGALVPEQSIKYASYLVNGFTTIQDPWYGYSPMYNDEMVQAGELVGPRWVGGLNGTAPVNWEGGEDIPDYAAAEALVKKHKSAGAFLIKEYGQPHRIQKQWLAVAAAKYGMRLCAEPFNYPDVMGKLIDGWNEIQHGLTPYLYKDLKYLMFHSGTTVALNEGAVRNLGQQRKEAWVRMLERKFETPKMVTGNRLLSPDWIGFYLGNDPFVEVALSRKQRMKADEVAEGIRSGLNVGIGTDNQTGYVHTHTKMWRFVAPTGLTNSEGLRILTINGARALGLADNIGSIEPGKMADLVILNSNPLDDITRTLDIKYIVKSGEVYDSQILDVLWPQPRKFIMFPWAAKPGEQALRKTE